MLRPSKAQAASTERGRASLEMQRRSIAARERVVSIRRSEASLVCKRLMFSNTMLTAVSKLRLPKHLMVMHKVRRPKYPAIFTVVSASIFASAVERSRRPASILIRMFVSAVLYSLGRYQPKRATRLLPSP